MLASPDGAPLRNSKELGVFSLVAKLPRYLQLTIRLLRDSRVSRLDRALVLAAFAYLLMPADVIPDVIPVLGQVDDLALISLSVGRLFERVAPSVLLENWTGEPRELEPQTVRKLLVLGSWFVGPRRRARWRARG